MKSSEDDGFIYVSYKKKKKSPDLKVIQGKESYFKYSSTFKSDSCHQSKLYKKEKTTVLKSLEKTDFFEEFKEIFNLIFKKWTSNIRNNELNDKMNALLISEPFQSIDIVCYGLGPFLSCLKACSQLAFLLALKNLLSIQKISLYDPVFSVEEITYLTELGFVVLSTNEKARRSVVGKTIFFMPHCDLPLYNNLLWSNWNINSMENVMIIGNSFSGYKRLLNSVLEENGYYVNTANQFITEVKIRNNFECHDVFNDMSIHYFEQDSLSKVSSEIWLKIEKPVYKSPDSIIYS